MTIQLLSMSVLYLGFNSPWTFILFASQYDVPENIARLHTFYGLYLRAYIIESKQNALYVNMSFSF